MTSSGIDPGEVFQSEVEGNLVGLASDRDLRALSHAWLLQSLPHRYSYNFSWLGRPIIQYPQDVVALQDLVWRIKPDLIIETGIAHGGSLILSASLLTLLEYCAAGRKGGTVDPARPHGRVIGVDIDIRPHNRQAIMAHPLATRIDMIEGSSINPDTVAEVTARARAYERILVLLDSNHTRDHVLAELLAYAPLVSHESYCVVYDTVVERITSTDPPSRPWGPGNSPMNAVDDFLAILATSPHVGADGKRLEFDIDQRMDAKLMISVAPRGYLRRKSIDSLPSADPGA